MPRLDLPLVITVLMLSACAHTPKVTLGYYQPEAAIDVSVTRTFACDSTETNVFEVTTADFLPRYRASASWSEIPIYKLDGTMADADFTLDLYEDGRLKGVNSVTTGKGEAILKSAVTIAKAVAFGVTRYSGKKPDKNPACERIAAWGGGKPVSITYATTVEIAGEAGKPTSISVAKGSEAIAEALSPYVGIACVSWVKGRVPTNVPGLPERTSPAELELKQPGSAVVQVTTAECTGPATASRELLVPQFGKRYFLPIPRARAFGKQTFELAVAESGAITKVRYGKENGSSQALNVLTNASSELTRTSAEKAQDANDRADEIAANARLVICRANPTTCK